MLKSVIVLSILFFIGNTTISNFSVEELTGNGNPMFFGDGYKLRKEANESFIKMRNEALKDGIKIQVVSSYRSYEHQKRIWSRKYNKFIGEGLPPEAAILKIIEYSTIPGTSRHHWGTDIDIIDGNVPEPKDVLNENHFVKGGVYVKLKKWMDKNADSFGFCLVYTDEVDRKGFKYEPWHYSYRSTSSRMLDEYLDIDIQNFLKKDKLLGSEYFTSEFIQKYISENILDINPDLK